MDLRNSYQTSPTVEVEDEWLGGTGHDGEEKEKAFSLTLDATLDLNAEGLGEVHYRTETLPCAVQCCRPSSRHDSGWRDSVHEPPENSRTQSLEKEEQRHSVLYISYKGCGRNMSDNKRFRESRCVKINCHIIGVAKITTTYILPYYTCPSIIHSLFRFQATARRVYATIVPSGDLTGSSVGI